MKRFFLLCLVALCALTTWANGTEVDGIYYTFSGNEATVTYTGTSTSNADNFYTGDIVIPSEVIYDGTSYTVVAIGDHAFHGAASSYSTVTSVTIPKTVTSIGSYAFRYNSAMTKITIPETVTSLNRYAFAYCTALTEINLLGNITTIENNLFYQCKALESITLPETIETIGLSAFESCTSLKEVTIGSNVTSIEGVAFYSCSSLEKFYSLNPEPPTCAEYDYIGIGILWGVFQDASLSTCTLYVPAGSREKYESADQWKEFSKITEIDGAITPPTVETVSVTDITNSTATLYGMVTAGSEEILEKGFQYWADANATQTIVATSVSGDEISSTIQRLSSATEYTYRAYALTESGYTYAENKKFTTTDYDFVEENSEGQTIYYKILSSSGTNRTCEVQYLYYASTDNIVAYEGELVIPNTVTHDGTTYNVIQINEYAFYECRNLTKVTIPESVTAIGPYSFQNCTSLEEATFPNTVSTIWYYTFDGCTNLKEAIIPSSVTTIYGYAFQSCTSITELTIPSTVEAFSEMIFANCTNLKKVTFEEGATETGAYMFDRCTSLEDVSMPNTMTEFGGYTFRNCMSLTSFAYPNSMTNTGTAAFYSSGIKDVTFSQNTTEISNGTFAYCNNIEKIAFPKGTKTLGYQLFLYCYNLKEVSLPKTVEEIGFQAFLDCSSMEKLYCLNPTPPALQDLYPYEWFEGINNDCVLYVPSGSREEYSTTDVWKDFFNTITEVATVETLGAKDITATSAVLNGAITAGDTPITQKGFEFWKKESENVLTTIYVEEDDLTYSITNLDPNTKYTYRAFAVTADGTFYGDEVEFTTAEDIPDGIDSIEMSSTNSENIEGIYSTSGQKLNTTQKGVNIIRYSDGITKKVIMK